MKKLIAILTLILIVPALACNLGAASPTPTPTIPTQAPAFNQPTLGLSPVVGPPGTIMNISAAGFTTGTRVNLFVSTLSKTSTQPVTTLTIGEGGFLKFAFQLPATVDGATIQNNTPLVFTMSAESGNPGASALFLALTSTNTGGTQPTALPGFGTDNTGGFGGGTGGGGVTTGTAADLYITAPPIGSTQSSGSVIVTGSGSSTSGRVTVQVLDANNAVIGSGAANIQAVAGYVGAWEATVAYTVPTTQQAGFIVAFTSEGKQASIPITFSPSGFVQPGNAIPALYPTLPPTSP
jgi:hypothetical protein